MYRNLRSQWGRQNAFSIEAFRNIKADLISKSQGPRARQEHPRQDTGEKKVGDVETQKQGERKSSANITDYNYRMFEDSNEEGYYADLESEAIGNPITNLKKAAAATKCEEAVESHEEEKSKGEASENVSDDSEIEEEQQSQQLQGLEELEELEEMDEDSIVIEDDGHQEPRDPAANFNMAYKEDDKAKVPER